jgi:hypothetical protein
VALVGLLPADFSTTGNLETLGRSSISLDLRHSFSRILAISENQTNKISCSPVIVKIFLDAEGMKSDITLGR